MKNVVLILLSVVLFSCGPKSGEQEEQTKQSKENWYKGNLHTHSLWSDGDDYPEMIMDWYKSNGYHFVSLTDHNVFQEGIKWSKVTKSPMRKKAFDRYLEKFGKDWVVTREDTAGIEVRLITLEEYRIFFEEWGKFTILKGEEISSSFDGKPLHVNATNINTLIPEQHGNSVVEVLQNVIDEVLKQRDSLGQLMFPHINHPNFRNAITIEDMQQLTGERFFEVYNGHPAVKNYGEEGRAGMEEYWDQINLSYIKNNKPLMWGIATDDSHNYHMTGVEFSNAGRGWVMVNAGMLYSDSLILAMERGDFYASTGVSIQNYNSDGNGISFDVIEEEGVKFVVQFLGIRKNGNQTETFSEIRGNSASYKFTGDELFVRARVISNKLQVNPFQTGDYEMAWMQPVIPESKKE